jgi:hypothetical protein
VSMMSSIKSAWRKLNTSGLKIAPVHVWETAYGNPRRGLLDHAQKGLNDSQQLIDGAKYESIDADGIPVRGDRRGW